MVYALSSHSLSLFKDCPRCFWMHKHKVWKRPEGVFPSLPSGMDLVLKKHFDSYIGKDKLPPELEKFSEMTSGLELYSDLAQLNIWRNNKAGVKYFDKDKNLLYGALDNLLVNKENNKLIVLDYKTRGFPLKEDTAAHYQNQMDIYNFLLRKNNHETEDFSLLLFYHPKEIKSNGYVEFNTDLIKIETFPDKAFTNFDNAINFLNGPCPKEKCEWCEGR